MGRLTDRNLYGPWSQRTGAAATTVLTLACAAPLVQMSDRRLVAAAAIANAFLCITGTRYGLGGLLPPSLASLAASAPTAAQIEQKNQQAARNANLIAAGAPVPPPPQPVAVAAKKAPDRHVAAVATGAAAMSSAILFGLHATRVQRTLFFEAGLKANTLTEKQKAAAANWVAVLNPGAKNHLSIAQGGAAVLGLIGYFELRRAWKLRNIE